MAESVLLVEDDPDIVRNLEEYLRTEGFEVAAVSGQEEALTLLEERSFDLVLLDITLSSGSGYGICRAVRANYDIPVIFLTALGDELSVLAGFDMGADDYITKPFRPRELVSRMRAVLRRAGKAQAVTETVDTVKAQVTKNGREIFLSALEYRILLVFLANRGKLLGRDALLDEIWNISGEYVNPNTVTVYIKRIREKIEDDPQNPKIIKTVRGLGYKMEG